MKSIIFFILSGISSYLIFSYILGDLNSFNWNSFERGTQILFWAFFIVVKAIRDSFEIPKP